MVNGRYMYIYIKPSKYLRCGMNEDKRVVFSDVCHTDINTDKKICRGHFAIEKVKVNESDIRSNGEEGRSNRQSNL